MHMGIEGKQDRKVWDTRTLPPPPPAPSPFFRSSSDMSVVLHVFSDERRDTMGVSPAWRGAMIARSGGEN